MDNIILKRYTSKSSVNIFETENSGVGFCEINDFSRNNFSYDKFSDIASDFDALIDVHNNIHIIYQNTDKNVIYILIGKTKSFKTELLKARNDNSAKIGKFRLFGNNLPMGVFYLIEKNSKNLLCCQFLDENSIPEALDLLSENFCEYIPLCDTFGNLSVLYCAEDLSLFGIRTLNRGEKKWSEFKPIEIRDNIKMLSAFTDEKNILHICYKSGDGLYYKNARSEFDGFKWSDEKFLTRQHIKASLRPLINKTDGVLTISWVTFDKIIAVISTDNGKTWSKLRELSVFHRNELQTFGISLPTKPINCEFYGYVTGNKLNIPMLATLIDEEFEKEKSLITPKFSSLNTFANFTVAENNSDKTNKISKIQNSTNMLTKADIERIKTEIAEKMKRDNSVSRVQALQSTDNIKIRTTSENIKPNMTEPPKPKLEKNDDNLKNSIESLCKELKNLTATLDYSLKYGTKQPPKHLKRQNFKRKKAILQNLHIKNVQSPTK